MDNIATSPTHLHFMPDGTVKGCVPSGAELDLNIWSESALKVRILLSYNLCFFLAFNKEAIELQL